MGSEVDNIIEGLPAHWERTTLGAICERGGGLVQTGPFGSQLHASDYVAVGTPSIMPVNIENFRVTEQGIERVAQADAERLSRHLVRPGDIVFSRRGDVERHALIRESERGWMCGTGCVLVRMGEKWKKDETPVLPEFASYWLRHPDVRGWIVAHAVGSTMPNLNTSIMAAIPFVVPPLPEQRAIARVLGGLDDKIELNRRMNRTLEDLARGLFRSWFVDFDPVTKPLKGRAGSASGHAHAAGVPSAAAGAALPAALGDGLPITPGPWPTRLVDSPLGPIPEGWRVGTVADLCTTQYGYTASATDEAVGPRMLRVTDMNKEPWVEWANVPHCRIDDDVLPRYALKLGDVLVSRMADPGKAAIVEEVLPEGAVFASYLIRLATRSIAASYYLFYYLRSDQYLDYAESVSGGTVQKNMNAQVITAAQMIIAPDAVADEFARFVRPWRAQIAANLQESRSLAALRDALLPQLLSGEIRLREAERAVDDAVQSTGPSIPAARRAAAGAKGRA